MWCPEMSGIRFPSCVLGSCVFFGGCFVSGDEAKIFFAFIFLVDLKACCNMLRECSLPGDTRARQLGGDLRARLAGEGNRARLAGLLAETGQRHVGQCPTKIHSGPNLLGKSKAYVSSVIERCRFCSSTVLWGK